MKADAHKQVQYLRRGMEQFLADEDKHIANGDTKKLVILVPRLNLINPEKFHAGTKVVKAMTQMAESKKQTKDTITPDNQYE